VILNSSYKIFLIRLIILSIHLSYSFFSFFSLFFTLFGIYAIHFNIFLKNIFILYNNFYQNMLFFQKKNKNSNYANFKKNPLAAGDPRFHVPKLKDFFFLIFETNNTVSCTYKTWWRIILKLAREHIIYIYIYIYIYIKQENSAV